jgi:MFS family permease
MRTHPDAPSAGSHVGVNIGIPKRVITGVGVCVLGNLIDGFDVLAIAFTAPAIAREWSVTPQGLGAVFSAGIAGITLGSLMLAPFADLVGRRSFAVAATLAMAASMLGCAFSAGVVELAAFRFVTGLGVGAILPTLNSVAAELAPRGRRNVVLSIFTAAYPLGSVLGGGLSVLLMAHYGWRSIFVAGAIATAIVAVLQWTWLPGRTPSDNLGRRRSNRRSLWRTPIAGSAALLATAFFFEMLAVFFVLNWTPRLLEQAGLGTEQSVAIAMVVNVGSLFGGLTYGFLADRFGWRQTATAYACAFAVLLVIFGLGLPSGVAIFALAVVLGFFLGGSMTSLYALAPVVFPSFARIGGTGLVIGIGRCGGVLGPLLAAYGVGAGYGPEALYVFAAAAPAAVAAAIIWLARRPLLDS